MARSLSRWLVTLASAIACAASAASCGGAEFLASDDAGELGRGGQGTAGVPVDAGRAGSAVAGGLGGAATGSGGTSGGGGGVTGGGGSGRTDAGASDVGGAGGAGGRDGSAGGTDAPPPCSSALSHSGCVECCNDRNPMGAVAFQGDLYGCACSDCYSLCSVTLCDTNMSRPSGDCINCIEQAGNTPVCANKGTACSSDPSCAPYGACVDSCF